MNETRMNVPSKAHWLLIISFIVSISLTVSAPFVPPLSDWRLLDIIVYEVTIIAGLVLIFGIIWMKGLPEEG
ncbi:MAG: hypothetical protein GF309_08235 [Candidatus Lokiarchaeota archaeon]|nr:hypothetical protein [Candidatus Lokiarchaeota archaeon]